MVLLERLFISMERCIARCIIHCLRSQTLAELRQICVKSSMLFIVNEHYASKLWEALDGTQ